MKYVALPLLSHFQFIFILCCFSFDSFSFSLSLVFHLSATRAFLFHFVDENAFATFLFANILTKKQQNVQIQREMNVYYTCLHYIHMLYVCLCSLHIAFWSTLPNVYLPFSLVAIFTNTYTHYMCE